MKYHLGEWQIELLVLSRAQGEVFTTVQDHTGRLCTLSEAENQTPCDGLIIKTTDLPAAVSTADCLPLVLTTAESAYALHISRKTLLTPLVTQTLKQLAKQIVTGIFVGPHICERHFTFEQAGEEIVAFKRKFPHAWSVPAGKTSLSLKKAVWGLLRDYVSPAVTIINDPRCTYETPNLPSYRRWLEGGKQHELLHLFTTVSREV